MESYSVLVRVALRVDVSLMCSDIPCAAGTSALRNCYLGMREHKCPSTIPVWKGCQLVGATFHLSFSRQRCKVHAEISSDVTAVIGRLKQCPKPKPMHCCFLPPSSFIPPYLSRCLRTHVHINKRGEKLAEMACWNGHSIHNNSSVFILFPTTDPSKVMAFQMKILPLWYIYM